MIRIKFNDFLSFETTDPVNITWVYHSVISE